MAKITDTTIHDVLTSKYSYSELDADNIVNECINEEEKLKEEKEPTTKTKAKYVIACLSNKNGTADTGWIIKMIPSKIAADGSERLIEEEWGELELEARIENWIKEFSRDKKFKASNYKCLGDFFLYGNKKIAKKHGLHIITKEPIYINKINPEITIAVDENRKSLTNDVDVVS